MLDKLIYAKICKMKICTYMEKYIHKYANNLQKCAKLSKHRHAFPKYA